MSVHESVRTELSPISDDVHTPQYHDVARQMARRTAHSPFGQAWYMRGHHPSSAGGSHGSTGQAYARHRAQDVDLDAPSSSTRPPFLSGQHRAPVPHGAKIPEQRPVAIVMPQPAVSAKPAEWAAQPVVLPEFYVPKQTSDSSATEFVDSFGGMSLFEHDLDRSAEPSDAVRTKRPSARRFLGARWVATAGVAAVAGWALGTTVMGRLEDTDGRYEAIAAWRAGNVAWSQGQLSDVCGSYDAVGAGGMWPDSHTCMQVQEQGFSRTPVSVRDALAQATVDAAHVRVYPESIVVIPLDSVGSFADGDFSVMKKIPGQGWRQIGARYHGKTLGSVPASALEPTPAGSPVPEAPMTPPSGSLPV